MSNDRVREYFNKVAPTYGTTHTQISLAYPLVDSRSRLAIEWLRQNEFPRDEWILDIGCGTGYFLSMLAAEGYRAQGVDISPSMVDEARGRLAAHSIGSDRAQVETGDALGWSAHRTFRCAVALGVLEYLPGDDEFFKAAGRFLLPGGILLLECRNALFNLGSANRFTRDTLNAGGIAGLLDEYEELRKSSLLRSLSDVQGEAVDALRQIFSPKEAEESSPLPSPARDATTQGFSDLARRQHTPVRLAEAAERQGFRWTSLRFLHHHPFPPHHEQEAPLFFRRLGLALDTVGQTAAAALSSSCFLAGFQKNIDSEIG